MATGEQKRSIDERALLAPALRALGAAAEAGDPIAIAFFAWKIEFEANIAHHRGIYEHLLEAAQQGDQHALRDLAEAARRYLEAANDHA